MIRASVQRAVASARVASARVASARVASVRVVLAVLAAVALDIAAPPSAAAQEREPLVQEGTTAIPQRVLARPDALVVEAPGTEAVVEEPWPFALFFVFDRREHDGRDWLEVAPRRAGPTTGWIAAEDTVAWRQSLVLAFTNPVDRLPVLFFDTRQSMIDLIEHERLAELAPAWAEAARAGAPPPESGIVSIERADHVDIMERFYLLPILDAEEVFVNSAMARSKIFEVASIPLDPEDAPVERPAPPSIGVVFVIDTTRSMQPYIDRTRQTVERIFDGIAASAYGGQVSFGLVGFRDRTDRAAGLDYEARVFHDLDPAFDRQAFLAALGEARAAEASSERYTEDGLTGVHRALELDSWKDFAGKFIIYIGDSDLREGPGPDGSVTGLRVGDVNRLARSRQIATVAILLRTEGGGEAEMRRRHATAERQLRALAFWREDWAPSYYAVPDAEPAGFGTVVDDLTEGVVGQIEALAEEQVALPGAADGPDCRDPDQVIDCYGHAMRLAWLGRQQGLQAPDVIRAWVPQIALDDPVNGEALEVRLLLTRDQMNNLYARLGLFIEAYGAVNTGESGAPGALFQRLRTILAEAAVDPTRLGTLDGAGTTTVEASDLPDLGGLLGEYFGQLPFRTTLMTTTREDWASMDGGDRIAVRRTVAAARNLMAHYYDESGEWIALHPGAADGEKVYPVPFEVLP